MLYHNIITNEEDKSVNRLCDKCSYQNDCFDETRCPFAIMDGEQNKREEGAVTTVKNFEYIKSLGFNEMVEFLAAGIGVPALDIASWLASDAE